MFMYSVNNKKYVNKGKMMNKMDILNIDGFLMASKNKAFQIQDSNIREIRVVNKQLAHPLASKKAFQKYDKLISYLTELLLSEDGDDDGENYREALNQIEKFRMEIKNKYRAYLKQKELEMMSHKLMILQKEAKERLLELQNSYLEYQNDHKRSK